MAYNPESTVCAVVARKTAANLNATAPSDIATMAVSVPEYYPRYMLIYNVTGNASSAVIDLRTWSGGGGTALISGRTLTELSAADKVLFIDLTASTDQLTASNLYVRLTTAAGAAVTADIDIYGIQIL